MEGSDPSYDDAPRYHAPMKSGLRRVLPGTTLSIALCACGGGPDGNSKFSSTGDATDTSQEETGSGDASTTADGSGTDSTSGDDSTTGNTTDPIFDVGAGEGTGPGDGTGGEMGCKKVDLLFVVDDSASMYEEQNKLTAAFPDFMATIDQELVQEKDIDYHVGVVSAEMAGSGMCILFMCADGFRGRLNHKEDRLSCKADEPPGRWIEVGPVDQVSAQFKCIASMEGQDFQEMPLEGMRAALTDRITDQEGYNKGFLREDALLVIAILTDEDDQSVWKVPEMWNLIPGPGPKAPVKDYWDAMVDLKGGDPNRVVVMAISGAKDQDCKDNNDEVLAAKAPRVHEFLEYAAPNSYWTDICGNDYVQPLQDALDVIQASCENFIPPG